MAMMREDREKRRRFVLADGERWVVEADLAEPAPADARRKSIEVYDCGHRLRRDFVKEADLI